MLQTRPGFLFILVHLLLIVGTGVAIYLLMPTPVLIENTQFSFDGDNFVSAKLPLAIEKREGNTGEMTVSMNFLLSRNYPNKYVFGLDCLNELTINGEVVGGIDPPCDGRRELNLSPYLHAGTNSVVVKLRDKGDVINFNVTHIKRELSHSLVLAGQLILASLILAFGLLHLP